MTQAGKVAVVTGGSKGIGYAIAEALVRAGAGVVISARDAEEVAAASSRLNALGKGRAAGVPCDVRRPEAVAELIRRSVAEFGGLDILVNNAGVGHFAPVADMPVERWQQMIDTNLSGAFYCSRAAIPHLRRRGGGWIINIGSLASKNPIAGGTAYNASKFGLLGMSEAMMLDVRHDNIRVSCLMPGSVATRFNDHVPGDADAWKIQPEDVAGVVLSLLEVPGRTMPSRVELRPTRPPGAKPR
jgi:3-oxoacyl-[acyl-carrier protein] reductase